MKTSNSLKNRHVHAGTFFHVLLIFFISFPVYAQTIQQERTVDPFTELELAGTARVELIQGFPMSVMVEASEDDQGLVTVKSKDEILKVSSKAGSTAVVTITAPQLNRIQLSDVSKLEGKTMLIQDRLNLQGVGAAILTLEVQLAALDINMSGASVMNISGKSESLNLKMTGAANGKFENLETVNANVTASGASSGQINVTDKVEGRVSGAASLKLVSEPLSNNLEVTSVASVSGKPDKEDIDIDIHLDDSGKLEDFMDKMKKKQEKKKANFNGHFQGVELGINTYMNRNYEFKLPEGGEFMEVKIPNSLVVNLNLLEANLPIIKQNLGLVTGLGIEFNNYKFEGSNYIKKIDGKIAALVPADSLIFDKSKLSCSYLKVPFMIEYQTNSKSSKNSFHFGAGANLGLRLCSHTKYNYLEDGKKVKEKEWDNFYLNPYRVAGIVKLGWGPLNFFAEYNFLTLFQTGKGPELYPVSFGIALANWD